MCPFHFSARKTKEPPHLIEYMETSLSRIPRDDTRLLQKEVGDFASVWFATRAELDLKVFPLVDQNKFVFQHQSGLQ